MRKLVAVVVVLLLCSSCGDAGGNTGEIPGLAGGAVFEGSFAVEPGIGPGSISFVLDDSASRIVTAEIDPALDEFACPIGRVFVSGGGISSTYTPGIAIESGTFDSGDFAGVFDSPTEAHGTFSLEDTFDCPYEVAWTASAVEAAGEAGTSPTTGGGSSSTSASAMTSTSAMTSAPSTTSTLSQFAELCTVNQRIVDRGAIAPSDPEAFWVEELADAALMVSLVPDHLRADMEAHAESLADLADLLSGYDYDFSAMMDDLGTEALDSIFTPEVMAADDRLQQFLATTCGG